MFGIQHSNYIRLMDNIFNSVYRQDFKLGYTNGLNPFSNIDNEKTGNEAYLNGFERGRSEYQSLNGLISDGIPEQIITNKILEEFLLAGMLGIKIEAERYTSLQFNTIQKWYLSGVEKYDPNESIYLLALLEKNGIYTR
jgi:hypothetical protein